ncbi:hypothetical protein [Desertivirga arenae]|uniref:hypothetical protein n=1 Tax=Desertivirga arenae TaxID=2810309 RepID=UPI001A9720FB|nr:hypothetical protein [Pedobacter sp. SYSU D00823]
MKISAILLSLNLLSAPVFAQPAKIRRQEYLRRAEEMYRKVWHHYRVPAHNLFAENFPSGGGDTPNY